MQEVYILALRNLDTLRDPLCINAWLTQINSRICYDMLEKRRRYATVDYRLELERADEELNPENQMLHVADEEQLYRLIDRLPDKQKQAVKLKCVRQMSLQRVADTMECSISSVTRYLKRARANLERMLRKE